MCFDKKHLGFNYNGEKIARVNLFKNHHVLQTSCKLQFGNLADTRIGSLKMNAKSIWFAVTNLTGKLLFQ
jgi:hypothetical protein